MKFLDNEKLAVLSNYLSGREVGDKILDGKIEAYSCT